MSLKLVARNKATVTVKGSITDDEGRPVKFDFVLICNRLSQKEIESSMDQSGKTVPEFIMEVTTGWSKVLDSNDQPLPFTTENLSELLNVVGLPGVCFSAYFKEVGAKEKN